jgi:ParB family chromosome partitioning protein
MAKKSGLGRGLSALIPVSADNQPLENSKFREIPITYLDPNPDQPRTQFLEDSLVELSDSIKEHGVIQPIIVTPNGDRYTVIAGERRWRATRLAGYEKIPAIVREVEPGQMLSLALLENIQRQELNPVEEAVAYRKLIDAHKFTHETLANHLGKSRVTISNVLRLLKLSDKVKNYIQDGKLSFGQARCLITLEDQEMMEALAQECISKGWSVRELERRVQAMKDKEPNASKARSKKSQQVKQTEKDLSKHFQSKVLISGDGKKGKITINYSNEAEYQKILGELYQQNE